MANLRSFYENKLAVISGGSSGIGLAIAKELAAHGAKVILLARRKEILSDACAQIIAANPESAPIAMELDVSVESSVKTVFAQIFAAYGVPDILVNSAGITQPGEFLTQSSDIFQAMMSVNYFGTLYCCQAVAQPMAARGSGIIVNISSVVGYFNIYGYSAYGASKFAVSGLSDSLRMELAPHGVQVALVFPPDTDTPQLAFERAYKPEVTRVLAGNGGLEQPETVAREILSALTRKKYRILPGFENKLINFAVHLLGTDLLYRLLDGSVRKVLRSQSPAQK